MADPGIPSADADYKSPPGMRLSPEVWDGVFASIARRLRDLEAKRVTLEETIDALQYSALQTVSATISAEINARRADLTTLEGEFKAVSDAYTQLVSGGVYADGIQLKPAIDGITGHTVQAALAALAEGAKTTGEAINNIRIVKHLAYDDRAQLRAINGPAESNAVVRGIGFFVWAAGSTESDDDETCFKTTSGAWLLEAVSMDAAFAYLLPLIEAADVGVPNNYRIVRSQVICTLTDVLYRQTATFTATVPDVALGDSVIVIPPKKLGQTATWPNLYATGEVKQDGKVEVSLCNASETGVTITAETRGLLNPWPILIIKAL